VEAARKVSLLDLTVDQIEQLEKQLELPVDRWTEYPSRAGLYRLVYAAATGTEPAAVGAMTLRQLTEAVSLGDDDDEGAEPANPT
jgi:hypothetical protein